jgi:hypothetical protein
MANKGTNENTSEGMGQGGHFLLTSGGTTAKSFTREIAVIEVLSGVIIVDSAEQVSKLNDIERKDDYSDYTSVTLEAGVHIVHFRKCSLSGATGVTRAYYGV